MAYDYEGRGKDVEVKGSTYRIPKDEDIADAPLAFEDYTNSIPFSEYVEVIEVDSDTAVDDSYNGKMIVATAPIELTLNDDLSDGFTVAAVAESDATIEYFGVDKQGQSTSEYEVATVVTVNGTNILSVARVGSSTPECPECPDEGPDLIGGVAGWAAIESVTGAADLQDLKDAGIAPGTATADAGCPGTYNVTQDGVVWRVAVFTDDGSISTSGGLVDALIVGGGGYSGADIAGMGGDVIRGLHSVDQSEDVLVGKATTSVTALSDPSSLGSIYTSVAWKTYNNQYKAPGAGGTLASPNTGLSSSITGSEIVYAAANSGAGSPGDGAAQGTSAGADGIVIVRAPKDAASNPKPDAPVAWGDFTTNGDEQASGEYGPDAQGRTWKWAEWNVADDYTVNLSGGQYWVLTVGAGSYGYNTAGYLDSGQPGLVNEGFWEFTGGGTPIKVGAKGTIADTLGFPSSIGGYGTQGIVTWGNDKTGRGSTAFQDNKGYTSYIRDGKPEQFAAGKDGADNPGRGNAYTSGVDTNRDGCVIIATVTNDESDWNPPGSLPGIGGWATVTEVKGKGTKYEYGDWVAFEWTDTVGPNSLTTSGGLVETLIVGGGAGTSGDGSIRGSGGGVITGIELLGVNNTVVVGKGGNNSGNNTTGLGHYSQLGEMRMAGGTRDISPNGFNRGESGGYYAGAGSAGAGQGRTTGGVGVVSSIRTGVDEMYASGGGDYRAPDDDSPGDGGHGDGQASGGYALPGVDGVVIIRVPKANDNSNLPAGAFDTTTLREALRETATEKVKSNRKRRK